MNTTKTNSPELPAINDNLAAYTSKVKALPRLSEEEERDLALSLREDRDKEVAHQLVLANMWLVITIARDYSGYGLSQEDLIQAGNMGLMKAVWRFDPDRGARLATFATYRIKAEINEYVFRNSSIIKIASTKAQRKLFFHKSRLMRGGEVPVESNEVIAQSLNVKPEEVEDMRRLLYITDTVPPSDGDDDTPGVGVEYVADESEEADPEKRFENRERLKAIEHAMTTLDKREREIFKARRLSDPQKTLQEIANEHGLSVEGVRQIEKQAIRKINAEASRTLAMPPPVGGKRKRRARPSPTTPSKV